MAEGSESVEMPGSSSCEETTNKPEEVAKEQVDKLMESDKEETLKTALNAVVQGKRHLLVKDWVSATSALGDACKLLAEIYGPISPEHADAHMYYGRALLEMARQELQVFEAPDDGKNDDDEESEDEEEEGDNDEDEEEGDEEKVPKEAGEEQSESAEAEAVPESSSGEAEAVSKESAEEDLSVPSPKPGQSTDNEQPSTSKGPAEADETTVEEEPGNLELAWDVFELAKLGYQKQLEILTASLEDVDDSKKDDVLAQINAFRKKIGDTHSYLGEVSIESENYDQGIEDFKTAIATYAELGDSHQREIAQCYFHIGIAHGLAQYFPDSVESFQQAITVIEERVKAQKEKVEEMKKAENADAEAIEKLESEIKELEETIPDVKAKIDDTLEQEKEKKRVAEEEKMEEEIRERNSPVKNPNPPAANDISHLIKKRKKIDDSGSSANGNGTAENGESEPPSKKACTSAEEPTSVSSSNGHSTTNGNGVA